MKFELQGCRLHVAATTPAEGVEICQHYRLKIEEHATDLANIGIATGTAENPWFARAHTAGPEWLKPYYAVLERVTGYTGPAFTIEHLDLRYPSSGRRGMNLCHTHIVERARIDEAGYHAEGFIQSQDWNGMPAEWRATTNFAEYVCADLGYTKSEPEYLELGNGLLRRNPNYTRRHAPEPRATSAALFDVIFNHWLEHHANAAQQALWAEGAATYRTVVKSDSLAVAMLRHSYDRFHIENYTQSVTLEEFRELGAY